MLKQASHNQVTLLEETVSLLDLRESMAIHVIVRCVQSLRIMIADRNVSVVKITPFLFE